VKEMKTLNNKNFLKKNIVVVINSSSLSTDENIPKLKTIKSGEKKIAVSSLPIKIFISSGVILKDKLKRSSGSKNFIIKKNSLGIASTSALNSIMSGAGSIINIFGDQVKQNVNNPTKSDLNAISADWVAVGNDFKRSLIQFENEQRSKKQGKIALS
jgi:hypothetical protein